MTTRLLWVSGGLLSTVLAIAGIVLPLLPTTPFLLLAAYCFAQSSPRLHDWLVSHPRLGPPIKDWQARGAIGRGAKVLAVVMMAATLVLSFVLGFGPVLIAVQAVVLAGAATFILTRPDG